MGWYKNLFASKKRNIQTYENNFNDLDIDSLFASLRANTMKIRRQEKLLDKIIPLQKPLNSYLALEKDVHNSLKNYAVRFKDSTDEKNKLHLRLIRNNPALLRMEIYEDEIPFLQQELRHVNNLVNTYKNNIEYLKEEKEDLISDRESLILGYNVLKNFGMFFLILLVVGLILIFAISQMLRESIWLYMSILAIVFMFFVVFLILTKEKLEKELRKNGVLQKKVAKYIQKFQIHYFNQQQYLNFQFKKLGIDNLNQLDNYFEKYLKNKDHEQNYKQYLQSMQISEQKIKEILRDYDIPFEDIGIIEEWILNPSKLEEAKNMVSEMENIQIQIEKMKEHEQELYQTLMTYGANPIYENIIKENMEQHYNWINEEFEKEVNS
ncbi:hypothetical protein AN641_08270 [Candidatus Epulonipiscioides gigas]|nr:hypothetical protein AN641_08270 [Epulopiscium sp. SCG-C07WGA-EpuloA2]